jgi:asparagine synthase (glutamine-hydrolysing)
LLLSSHSEKQVSMCGIFGAVTELDSNPIKDLIKSAFSSLKHRGPNDCGFFIDDEIKGFVNTVVLGHTRLSVIDLTSAGHQPMTCGFGRYAIVFNGEIYNYRELKIELQALGFFFHSDTDTEVLLAALTIWGLECLNRLVGMFAFAFYDKKERNLFLARDAFGIKPLFYHPDPKFFAFASEMPALLKMMPKRLGISLKQACDYLVHGSYDQSACTFLDGIYHLPPGHWMQVDLATGKVGLTKRWWWPSIQLRSDINFQEAVSQLRELFLKSVRLHLRSDVPLGAALSGGIDSSAVVCAMRYLEPEMPIHTFTYVARGSTVDEESWADIVNQHVGAITHKVIFEPSELLGDMEDMIASQGEPFGSTSIYAQYRVFRRVREEGVVVTLDGQGADEMLAGYGGYPYRLYESLLEQQDQEGLDKFLQTWPEFKSYRGKAGWKAWLRNCTPAWVRNIRRKMLGKDKPAWVRYVPKESGLNIPNSIFPTRDPKEGYGRRLVEELRDNLCGRGLASLLRHGDRNSMRYSVESRVPFLTTEIAEFLLQLPESFLLSNTGETKSVFRAAMRGIVPDAILDRRDKIGFETPERDLLLANRDKLNEWLDKLDDIPFVDAGKCRLEMEEVLSGQKPFSFMPWRVINYCRWVSK